MHSLRLTLTICLPFQSSIPLSRTSLATPTSTLRSGTSPSDMRVSKHDGTTTRALPSAAQSDVLSSPTSRLQSSILATGTPALRGGKPAVSAALLVPTGATTRAALPPVRSIPAQVPAATLKPQVALSAKLPVPAKPLSAASPKYAAPRVAKASKLSPLSRL